MGLLIEIATADAGLVRDDDDRPMQLIRPQPRQLENSEDELELVEATHIAAIHDHAVAVEKERATGHIFGRVHPLRPPLGGRVLRLNLRNYARFTSNLPPSGKEIIRREAARKVGSRFELGIPTPLL